MSVALQQVAGELGSNLGEQVRIWRHLLGLSVAQQDAVRAQDVHAVHALLQEIEVAMLDRSRAELRRGMLIEQAAVALGVPAAEVTRSLLVERVDPQLGAQLDAAAAELQQLIEQLDEVVATNRVLLEHELTIVATLVEGMTVDHTARPTYGKTGSQQQVPRLRLLDAQV